mgnify:CR=1 FL=1
MRALPVLAVALLVCSAVVGATGGLAGVGAPDVTTDPDSDAIRPVGDSVVTQADGDVPQQINVLDIPPTSVERWAVDRQYVDLGPALALSTNQTTHQLQTLSMVEEVEATETDAEREARLEAALTTLEAEVDELDQRQTDAVAAYGRGEITSRDLLVTLVRISITAEELNERRGRIDRFAAGTRGVDIDRGRLASISNQLSAFTGPVRAHAESVLRGEVPPHRFYLATGPQSVTVSTVVDDTYIREAYRGDLRNGVGDAIELEVALDIVSESYPVIWNTTREQTQVFGGGETYPVRVVHGRGDLTAFVDSNARVVYAEHQRRPLSSFTAERRADRTAEGLRLRVNHTYPGGPVEVRVVDSVTGDPVDANVSMSIETGPQRTLGTTGGDGVLWTLSPYRSYTISADGRNGSVDATVEPGSPPRVKPTTTDSGDGNESAENESAGNETATATPTPTITPIP